MADDDALRRMVDIVRGAKFGLDCDASDFDARLVEAMQNSYEEDGNPFAIWVAVDWCKQTNSPFSQWMIDVLAGLGSRIFDVFNREEFKHEAENVGKALGFGSDGKGRDSKAGQMLRMQRDDNIAFHIAAEMWMAAERGVQLGETKVAASVATEFGVSPSTAERAWKDRGEAARSWLKISAA